jgi:hypothetical protein
MFTPSAAAAISPAIERTKLYLFQPFRLGRFFKLTLVAALTEGGVSSCNTHSGGTSGHPGGMPPLHWPAMPWPAVPVLIGIGLAALLIVVPIVLLISYLLIRLRFSYFDCVLCQQDQIAPAWGRFHRQAMRYLGLTVLVGLGFWAVLIPIGYAVYQQYKPLFQGLGSDHPPGFMEFLPLIGVGILVLGALGVAGYLIDSTMSCFLLPRMAIDDSSIGESIAGAWADIQADPGQFGLFFLLRLLLAIALSIAGAIAVFIPVILLAILGVILVVLFKAVSPALAISLGVPAGIIGFLALLVIGIGVGGTIGTFHRNYALLFYAGRYRALAMELFPPPVPLAQPPADSGQFGQAGFSGGVGMGT